jgi:hypothetical protein
MLNSVTNILINELRTVYPLAPSTTMISMLPPFNAKHIKVEENITEITAVEESPTKES